jgi:hypothetical protein
MESKVIEALLLDDSSLDMTIKDVQQSTVQEILLYYAYTTIHRMWRLDFINVPKSSATGKFRFDENHDLLIIAYLLTNEGAWVATEASQETKNEILKYLKLYDLLDDYRARRLMDKLNIYDYTAIGRRKQAIFDAHRETKSARS